MLHRSISVHASLVSLHSASEYMENSMEQDIGRSTVGDFEKRVAFFRAHRGHFEALKEWAARQHRAARRAAKKLLSLMVVFSHLHATFVGAIIAVFARRVGQADQGLFNVQKRPDKNPKKSQNRTHVSPHMSIGRFCWRTLQLCRRHNP